MNDNKTLGPTTYPKRHPFVDIDNVVEWDIGVFQHFPKPQLIETSGLECGPPGSWDARVAAAWGSILFDDGKFRGWVCTMPGIGSLKENCDVWRIGYAESDDGIHWRKLDVKLVEQSRWPGNNLLKLPGCVMSVVRPLPKSEFKFLALTIVTPDAPQYDEFEFHGYGSYLFGSDDGIRWKQLTKNPMVQHGDWACLHVDHACNRYLLYYKMGANHGLTSRRSMIVLESEDAIHWQGYYGYRQWHETFVADDFDDLLAQQRGYRLSEYYSHTLHQIGPLYVAVQTLFTVGLPLRQLMGKNPNGHSHLRLAFSHDGITWRHPRGRPAFVEIEDPGAFGSGFITSGSNILERGDDMWLFCGAADRDHGWGIRPDFSLDPDIKPVDQERRVRMIVAKFKRDRFASLGANQTSRFDVEIGPRQTNGLTVNVLTRGTGGVVRVAIAEQRSPYHLETRKSESLPGFSFDDCVPITGDSVHAAVRFRKAQISDIPTDKSLILRFEVTNGEVFGYEWVA